MQTLIVFESIYGNTHAVAEAIADGLRPHGEVRIVPAGNATADLIAWADLVVVGGPTHAHGMTRDTTRKGARETAAKPGSPLTLDSAAGGPGIRDWLGTLVPAMGKRAAAFDTRFDGPVLFTGRASSGIASELRRRGFSLVTEPESFLVDRETRLVPGEAARAAGWAAGLATGVLPAG